MLLQAWLTDAWTLPLWSMLSPGSEECLGRGPWRPGRSPLCPPFPPGLGVLSSRFLPTSWAPQVDILTVKEGEPSAIVFGAGTGDPQVFLSWIL